MSVRALPFCRRLSIISGRLELNERSTFYYRWSETSVLVLFGQAIWYTNLYYSKHYFRLLLEFNEYIVLWVVCLGRGVFKQMRNLNSKEWIRFLISVLGMMFEELFSIRSFSRTYASCCGTFNLSLYFLRFVSFLVRSFLLVSLVPPTDCSAPFRLILWHTSWPQQCWTRTQTIPRLSGQSSRGWGKRGRKGSDSYAVQILYAERISVWQK